MNEKDESRNDGEEKADGAGTLQHYTRLKRIICTGSLKVDTNAHKWTHNAA